MAVSSVALALASSGAIGCGGTGERQKPDTLVTTDAGLTVDPCNLTDTLDIHQFGCTPGAITTRRRCADFEGYPEGTGNLPTDWFE